MPIIKINLLSIFNGIIKMLTIGPLFFLAIHFKNIGLSGNQIGIIFTVSTLTTILTIIPTGITNDKIKSKCLISIGLALTGIQFLGFAHTREFYLIILLAFIGGLGTSLYNTSADSLFFKSTEKENIPQKVGLFNSIKFIFISFGLILTGYLLKYDFNFSELFGKISLAFLISAIIGQIFLPKNSNSQFNLFHYKKDIFKKEILTFLAVVFLFALHFGAEATSYALFLKENLKLDNSGIGLYMGISVLPMALTAWFIAKKFHKLKSQNILLAGLFISGTGHILMTLEPVGISLFFRIYHEIGDATIFFFIYFGISKIFDLSRIGGNSSIFNFTATIGNAIGALIFGNIGEIYAYKWPLILSGVSTLFAFILTLSYISHFKHQTT